MKIKSLTLTLATICVALSTQGQNHWPTTGSAGIGTGTAPAERFELRDAAPSYLKITRNADVLGTVGGIKFDMAGTEVGRIETERLTASNRFSAMIFSLKNWLSSANMIEVMRIHENGMLGLGTPAPLGKLHVHAPHGTRLAVFTLGDIPHTSGVLDISNATGTAGHFIPYVRGRSYYPGHAMGLYLVGEAEDVAPPSAFEAAVILDGRTNMNTRASRANILAINSMGINLAVVKADGSMGIGTPVTHGHKLAVNGSGLFTKVVVKQQSAWPDFVFEPDYQLRPLPELAAYIREHKHLPEMPTAEDVARDGQDLGEVNRRLLQKVEEMTLYIIEQDKARKSVEDRLSELEVKLEKLMDKR